MRVSSTMPIDLAKVDWTLVSVDDPEAAQPDVVGGLDVEPMLLAARERPERRAGDVPALGAPVTEIGGLVVASVLVGDVAVHHPAVALDVGSGRWRREPVDRDPSSGGKLDVDLRGAADAVAAARVGVVDELVEERDARSQRGGVADAEAQHVLLERECRRIGPGLVEADHHEQVAMAGRQARELDLRGLGAGGVPAGEIGGRRVAPQ